MTVSNFRNKVAMTIIFFSKGLKFDAQKNQQFWLVWKIIAFQSRTSNSHNLEQDICHWQSMSYETPLRFNISLREIFSKLGSLRVMKKYDESALCRFYKSLGHFNTLTVEGCSETVFFREWSDQSLWQSLISEIK